MATKPSIPPVIYHGVGVHRVTHDVELMMNFVKGTPVGRQLGDAGSFAAFADGDATRILALGSDLRLRLMMEQPGSKDAAWRIIDISPAFTDSSQAGQPNPSTVSAAHSTSGTSINASEEPVVRRFHAFSRGSGIVLLAAVRTDAADSLYVASVDDFSRLTADSWKLLPSTSLPSWLPTPFRVLRLTVASKNETKVRAVIEMDRDPTATDVGIDELASAARRGTIERCELLLDFSAATSAAPPLTAWRSLPVGLDIDASHPNAVVPITLPLVALDRLASGYVSSGAIGGAGELVFCAPDHPVVKRLFLPRDGDGPPVRPDVLASYTADAGGKCSDNLLVAGGGNLYALSAADSLPGTKQTAQLALSHDCFRQVVALTSIVVPTKSDGSAKLFVWGLNQSHDLFETTATLASDGTASNWRTPEIRARGVVAYSALHHVQSKNLGLCFIDSAGKVTLIERADASDATDLPAPATSSHAMWVERSIHAQISGKIGATKIHSFTTHIERRPDLTKDNAQKVPSGKKLARSGSPPTTTGGTTIAPPPASARPQLPESLWLHTNRRTPVFINGVYTLLGGQSPTEVRFLGSSVTIVEATASLRGTPLSVYLTDPCNGPLPAPDFVTVPANKAFERLHSATKGPAGPSGSGASKSSSMSSQQLDAKAVLPPDPKDVLASTPSTQSSVLVFSNTVKAIDIKRMRSDVHRLSHQYTQKVSSGVSDALIAPRTVPNPEHHDDFVGFLNDIDPGIVKTWNEIAHGVENAWSAVKNEVGDIVAICVKIAGQLVQLAINTVDDIAHGIELIFKAIENAIEKLIAFLEFLFEWKSFKRTKDAFDSLLELPGDLVKAVDFEGPLQTIIGQLKFPETNHQQSPKHESQGTGSSSAGGLILNHVIALLMGGASGAMSGVVGTKDPFDGLIDLVTNIDLPGLVQDPMTTLEGMGKSLLTSALGLLTGVGGVASILEEFSTAIGADLDVPFLSEIFKLLGLGSLTISAVFGWAAAIFVTIITKIVSGDEPFPQAILDRLHDIKSHVLRMLKENITELEANLASIYKNFGNETTQGQPAQQDVPQGGIAASVASPAELSRSSGFAAVVNTTSFQQDDEVSYAMAEPEAVASPVATFLVDIGGWKIIAAVLGTLNELFKLVTEAVWTSANPETLLSNSVVKKALLLGAMAFSVLKHGVEITVMFWEAATAKADQTIAWTEAIVSTVIRVIRFGAILSCYSELTENEEWSRNWRRNAKRIHRNITETNDNPLLYMPQSDLDEMATGDAGFALHEGGHKSAMFWLKRSMQWDLATSTFLSMFNLGFFIYKVHEGKLKGWELVGAALGVGGDGADLISKATYLKCVGNLEEEGFRKAMIISRGVCFVSRGGQLFCAVKDK